VFLREVVTEEDRRAYLAAIAFAIARPERLDAADGTGQSAEQLALDTDPSMLHLGIWSNMLLVGGVALRPGEEGAEMSFWVGQRHADYGYATVAIRALAGYAAKRGVRVLTHAAVGDYSSVRVFTQAGFRCVNREGNRLHFEFIRAQALRLGLKDNLERFVGLPNKYGALRAKDKDGLTVFLLHAKAKWLYRCPCCGGNIDVGSEHAVLSRVQTQGVHARIDLECVLDKVLPTLSKIAIVDPRQIKLEAESARWQKYWNRKRHSR
jgi:hypothetical protein